ncbi:hypothetical protein [Prochlorococcus sp. MIT 1307]|uniref:hypothetical protein n=1 Tax=Prochlorococcus sp. MIT 1307 TaxID=3096219 RepID=UPI002A759F30|nr:hypothetical protein [Prochlorococcus sp. MIT 1307]
MRRFRGEKISMLDGLLNSERAKVLAVIAIVAVGTGVTAKNVISYPIECMTEQQAHVYEPVKRA